MAISRAEVSAPRLLAFCECVSICVLSSVVCVMLSPGSRVEFCLCVGLPFVQRRMHIKNNTVHVHTRGQCFNIIPSGYHQAARHHEQAAHTIMLMSHGHCHAITDAPSCDESWMVCTRS